MWIWGRDHNKYLSSGLKLLQLDLIFSLRKPTDHFFSCAAAPNKERRRRPGHSQLLVTLSENFWVSNHPRDSKYHPAHQYLMLFCSKLQHISLFF
uniref:Uncharacterized protein n=1 Tax=Cairina moschata TaxID=8855 RepID=A0A8C3BBC5_CAIMO